MNNKLLNDIIYRCTFPLTRIQRQHKCKVHKVSTNWLFIIANIASSLFNIKSTYCRWYFSFLLQPVYLIDYHKAKFGIGNFFGCWEDASYPYVMTSSCFSSITAHLNTIYKYIVANEIHSRVLSFLPLIRNLFSFPLFQGTYQ